MNLGTTTPGGQKAASGAVAWPRRSAAWVVGGVDLATYWAYPGPAKATGAAFRVYRNFAGRRRRRSLWRLVFAGMVNRLDFATGPSGPGGWPDLPGPGACVRLCWKPPSFTRMCRLSSPWGSCAPSPKVVSLDATPKNFDHVGEEYGHKHASVLVETVKAAVVRRALLAAGLVILVTAGRRFPDR